MNYVQWIESGSAHIGGAGHPLPSGDRRQKEAAGYAPKTTMNSNLDAKLVGAIRLAACLFFSGNEFPAIQSN